jgi:uncharacterized membrane protein YgcG
LSARCECLALEKIKKMKQIIAIFSFSLLAVAAKAQTAHAIVSVPVKPTPAGINLIPSAPVTPSGTGTPTAGGNGSKVTKGWNIVQNSGSGGSTSNSGGSSSSGSSGSKASTTWDVAKNSVD